MRVTIAFLFAPIFPALVALTLSSLQDDVVYWEFILGMGAIAGYSIAGLVGIPAYFLIFKDLKGSKLVPCTWFFLFSSSLYWVFFGASQVGKMGLWEGLTNPTYWGYGLVFSIAAAVAIFVFYIIAFHEFRRSQT